ncbi:lipopolysaccharide biosynthesis protein [Bacteroides sp. AN502(2024)]|uniref:lipopolysaccharide biosynthesis protein n=1 Tax=Bacteroides sp. AN502(2024) TaxID=3160599 RepID=UPI00351508E5
MSIETQSNNKRIARNTLLLYIRTILVMVISLYTSRVILSVLGVDNYGIYNVVGGVVAMFSVVSGALSGSISRFITFELGHGNVNRLRTIFSTSINIQIGISLLIFLLGETIGFWFLNNKIDIPAERLHAANWVLQCSLATFIINLISVPYNAVIIAHEKMSVFAYVSILEAALKLFIVYFLYISAWDKLIVYSLLLVLVAIVIRIVYGVYCNRYFAETRYQRVHDRTLLREMALFAGWGFFTNAVYMFNTQGINILINLSFGVTVNAARGIATQVEAAMIKFVNDFTTALNPQITKSYAARQMNEMYKLVNRGAKFSAFLTLAISLPVLFEADYILGLWLEEVPPHTVAFVRLGIIATMLDRLGNTGYTACMATGTIRRYVLLVSTVGCLVFPVTYLVFEIGAPVEAVYVVFCGVYVAVDAVRLYVMKGLLKFPVMSFVRGVIGRILLVAMVSCILPSLVIYMADESFSRLVISTMVCLASSIAATYYVGFDSHEQKVVTQKVVNIYKNKIKRI